MGTSDVLKVLKLHSPTARAILRTFKISLVPINHEMHSRSYDFLYLYQRLLAYSKVPKIQVGKPTLFLLLIEPWFVLKDELSTLSRLSTAHCIIRTQILAVRVQS